MRLLRFASLAALVVAGALALPAEEELKLVGGDVLTGEVLKEGEDSLDFRRLVLVKRTPTPTTTTIIKKNIISRRSVPSFKVQYVERAKGAPDTFEGQLALSRWCHERCLMDEAAVHARRAADMDPEHPLALKAMNDLGFVRAQGAWQREGDYLAATNQVAFNGKIMSPAEAEKQKALINATAARDQAEKAVKDAEWVIKNGDEKLKDASARNDEAKKEFSTTKGEYDSAKSAFEAADKRISDAAAKGKSSNPKDEETRQQAAQKRNSLTAAVSAQERKSQAATKALETLKAQLDKAKKELPELKQAQTKAQAELDVLSGKAPAVLPADPAKDKPTVVDKNAPAKGRLGQ